MSKITYVEKIEYKVYSGDKHVGNIRYETEAGGMGWRYYAKGNKFGGDFFASLEACQRSVEG